MIELRILGGLELRDDSGESIESLLAQSKRLAVLAYLAAAAPRGSHRRDTLLAMFWPESDTRRARDALRQVIAYLRRSLGADVLVGHGDELALNWQRFWCDATAFEEVLAAGDLKRCVELYRGDLLPGFHLPDAPEFGYWLDAERTRLRAQAAEAALRLAQSDDEQGNPAGAAYWARKAVAISPYDEIALRRLIVLLDRAGDRAGAVSAYEDFARRLAEELGLDPAMETVALADAIRTGPIAVQHVVPDRPEAWEPASDPSELETSVAATATGAKRLAEGRAGAAGPGRSVLSPERLPSRRGGAILHRWRLAVLSGVFVTASAAAWWSGGLQGARGIPPSAPPARSVAVLPFENLSSDPSNIYFADGITEEILNSLAQSEGLRVPSRTSSFQFRGTITDIRAVGERLGVATVLEGSVRREGDRLRVTAQLVDAASGYHLWSEVYDRDLADVFAVQGEIAEQIATTLRVKLAATGDGTMGAPPTGSVTAYDLYLRGREYFVRLTPGDNEWAVRLFRDAVAADSGYALAYAGLSRAYLYSSTVYGASALTDSAAAYARKAIALAPGLAEGHVALGRAYEHQGRPKEARKQYLRAVDLNANHADAVAGLAETARGDLAEMLRWQKKAVTLRPTDAEHYRSVGNTYLALGTFEQAEQWFRKALRVKPDDARAHERLADLYEIRGEPNKAAIEIQEMLAKAPDQPWTHEEAGNFALRSIGYAPALRHFERAATLHQEWKPSLGMAFVYMRTGKSDKAEEILRHREQIAWQQLRTGNQGPGPYGTLSGIYSIRGDKDEALRWHQAAIDRGWRRYQLVPGDPFFENLRGDARFERMRAEMRSELDLVRKRVERETVTGRGGE